METTLRPGPTLPLIAVLIAACAGGGNLTPEALALRDMCNELKRALYEDPVVRSFLVYPRCQPGRVTLNGSVRDYEGWERAQRITYEMTGVRNIQNNLEILEEDPMFPDVNRR